MLVFNWGWIGIALACLVAGFVGGCEHNKHIIDAYEAAGKAQEAQTAQTIQKHKQIATEVKNDYENRIAAIRAAYRVRPSGTGLVPPTAKAPGGADAGPSYSILAESCAETTQQLVSLQDFVKETQ